MWEESDIVFKCAACQKLVFDEELKLYGACSRCKSRKVYSVEVTKFGKWLYTKINNFYKFKRRFSKNDRTDGR